MLLRAALLALYRYELLSFLRDLHNDFHSGLGVTHVEMIMGIPEVDQAMCPLIHWLVDHSLRVQIATCVFAGVTMSRSHTV